MHQHGRAPRRVRSRCRVAAIRAVWPIEGGDELGGAFGSLTEFELLQQRNVDGIERRAGSKRDDATVGDQRALAATKPKRRRVLGVTSEERRERARACAGGGGACRLWQQRGCQRCLGPTAPEARRVCERKQHAQSAYVGLITR